MNTYLLNAALRRHYKKPRDVHDLIEEDTKNKVQFSMNPYSVGAMQEHDEYMKYLSFNPKSYRTKTWEDNDTEEKRRYNARTRFNLRSETQRDSYRPSAELMVADTKKNKQNPSLYAISRQIRDRKQAKLPPVTYQSAPMKNFDKVRDKRALRNAKQEQLYRPRYIDANNDFVEAPTRMDMPYSIADKTRVCRYGKIFNDPRIRKSKLFVKNPKLKQHIQHQRPQTVAETVRKDHEVLNTKTANKHAKKRRMPSMRPKQTNVDPAELPVYKIEEPVKQQPIKNIYAGHRVDTIPNMSGIIDASLHIRSLEERIKAKKGDEPVQIHIDTLDIPQDRYETKGGQKDFKFDKSYMPKRIRPNQFKPDAYGEDDYTIARIEKEKDEKHLMKGKATSVNIAELPMGDEEIRSPAKFTKPKRENQRMVPSIDTEIEPEFKVPDINARSKPVKDRCFREYADIELPDEDEINEINTLLKPKENPRQYMPKVFETDK